VTDSARGAPGAARGHEPGAGSSAALPVLLSFAFCFSGLSNHPLRAADEPRVAGIAWEMAHTGDVLVPHLGGEPFLEHPPLYYAALAATLRVLGSSDGAARLPGALAAAATLLLAFDLARRMAGWNAGLMSILVLASAQGFFKYSHKVMVDAWLTAAVTLGFWAYARAACESAEDADPPGHLVLLLYAAAVVAFLVKGPVGVILLGGVVGVHVLATRRWRFLRSRAHVLGALLLLAGCAAWPAALRIFAGRESFDAFFWDNFVYRIVPVPGVYAGGHEEPPWFYLLNLPTLVGVWIAVLPALAIWVLRGAFPPGWNRRLIRFTAGALPVGLVLLSVPGTKRSLYLLPALPALAAAVGAWIASTALAPGVSRVERGTLRACAALVALPATAARVLALPAAWLARRAGAAAVADRLTAATAELLERARAETAGAVPTRAASQVAWLAFGFAVLANVVLLAPGDPGRDLGPIARAIAELARNGRPLVAYELDEQMRGALPFYTGTIVTNLHGADALGRFARETPGGLVLQGDYRRPGFPEQFPELRELHDWPMAEGVYRVYEVADSQSGAVGTRSAGEAPR